MKCNQCSNELTDDDMTYNYDMDLETTKNRVICHTCTELNDITNQDDIDTNGFE